MATLRMARMMALSTALLLTAIQESIAQLPLNSQLEQDWLLDPSGYDATVVHDKEQGTITLSNGLFSRVIDTRLGTTIRYLNLMTGETIIRAVESEGSVTLDGVEYPIGGAKGQPNKAFLTPEIIAALQPLPDALQFRGHEIGKPKERLKWKRVRHHAPDAVWPPMGAYLRLDYNLPPHARSDEDPSAGAMVSDSARKLLFSDTFEKLDAAWKVHVSKAHEQSTFTHEGRVAEIYALPSIAVYAERSLPDGTRMVEAEIDAGTDSGADWGPGIALVYEKRVYKFFMRMSALRGVNHPVLSLGNARGLLNVSGSENIDPSKPWTLRIRMGQDKLFYDAKPEGGAWKNYSAQNLPAGLGAPTAFRVGKCDRDGGNTDAGEKWRGDRLGRSRINKVAFYSAFDAEELTAMADEQQKLTVSVHYGIYDGIPSLSKWITVTNGTGAAINLDRFNAETLAVVESGQRNETDYKGYGNRDATVKAGFFPILRRLHVETDMAFGGASRFRTNNRAVHWRPDKDYITQVQWAALQPCYLQVEPTFGPDQTIEPGGTFESFRVFELVPDTHEQERRSLALRKQYRILAPWVTENPLMMHLTYSNHEVVRFAIDQAAEVGFEMVIISVHSGFRAEDGRSEYRKPWRELNDYALSKGIQLGAYSLYGSRKGVPGGDMIRVPKDRKTANGLEMSNAFNSCPAVTSAWGQRYLNALYSLFDDTGFLVFEHDGPYPGDVDVTPRPPLQKGVNDSRWVHWRIWTDFYKHLRSKGVYMNLPDYYFLSGSNKGPMGYREWNWSLPRADQRLHTRQNIFDGSWEKTPSMGWMFVPLTKYHGGGAAATVEPLHQHLKHYDMMLKSNLGLGVQACYRGHRLYDTDETKEMVKKNVTWYKKYRNILESDLIHGRRADGMDIDWMLHANPKLKQKGMLVVYNPLKKDVTRTIRVPLYYTGLTETAKVAHEDGEATAFELARDYSITLPVTAPAEAMTWFVIE